MGVECEYILLLHHGNAEAPSPFLLLRISQNSPTDSPAFLFSVLFKRLFPPVFFFFFFILLSYLTCFSARLYVPLHPSLSSGLSLERAEECSGEWIWGVEKGLAGVGSARLDQGTMEKGGREEGMGCGAPHLLLQRGPRKEE